MHLIQRSVAHRSEFVLTLCTRGRAPSAPNRAGILVEPFANDSHAPSGRSHRFHVTLEPAPGFTDVFSGLSVTLG